MNLSTPPPNDDGGDNNKRPKKPSLTTDEALQAAQQKHRKEEREAITLALKAHFDKTSPTDLTFLGMRWDASILNQLHQGSWDSLWSLLNQASRVPSLCSRGVILFGGWFAQPPENLTCATTPPQEFLAVLKDYSFHCETLRLIRLYDEAKVPELYQERNATLRRWLKNHPELLSLCPNTWDFKPVADISNAFLKDFLPLIKSSLMNLDSRAFLFAPEPNDLSAGWKEFLSFAGNYSSLPPDLINGFGSYFLLIQTPSE